MIVVISKDSSVALPVVEELHAVGALFVVISPLQSDFMDTLFKPQVSAVVALDGLSDLPRLGYVEFLNGLSRRVPVLVADIEALKGLSAGVNFGAGLSELSDAVTVLPEIDSAIIVATLDVCGALRKDTVTKKVISYYNTHAAVQMLCSNGGLGILSIDASSFRSIEVEYGTAVYEKVKSVFHTFLTSMWGKSGCFRSNDILCKKSDHGALYYVFIQRSRTTGALPLPGVMEEISDRISRLIYNALLSETSAPHDKRSIPSCVESLPTVSVGHGAALFNPCLDPRDTIQSAMESGAKFARIHEERMEDRFRETMATLIQGKDLLEPQFQAVFTLGTLTQNEVNQAVKEKSITPLLHHLHGFESLIRIKKQEISALLGASVPVVNPEYLRPDVLFSLAKRTNVALELDQACLKLALLHGKNLPGVLMINILPRNMQYVTYMEDLFTSRQDIVLEISESEDINNFESLEHLRKTCPDIKIAADDFGRAFAGLSRVIRIKPDLIKLDRSLLQDIHEDPIKQAYLQGLVTAAKMLRTVVLAEGVEKWEEAVVLQQMGVDLIQGFLLHRPQTKEAIAEAIYAQTDSTLQKAG